jgi:hypothetical protein
MYTVEMLDTRRFDTRAFKLKRKLNQETGEVKDYYLYNYKGVKIAYFIDSHILSVQGRLINLSHKPNKVDNLDTLWSGDAGTVFIEREVKPDTPYAEEPYYDIDDNLVFIYNEPTYEVIKEDYEEDVYTVIDDLNRVIEGLIKVKVDVRQFFVSYIEICFNVHTECVGEYLTIFNEIFKKRNFQQYRNYIIENKLPYNTSYYVKTKSDYENPKRPRTNYTINFYNKLNQLSNALTENKGKPSNERSNITHYDLELANDVLRLEVQCKYHYLRDICKRSGISRTFGNLLNIELCANIIKEKYGFFIDSSLYCRFTNYKSMQDEVKQSTLSEKDKQFLLKYLPKYAMGHKIGDNTLRKYKKLLSEIGLHHHLIPTKWNLDILEAPMQLLDKEIQNAKQQRIEFLVAIGGYTPEEAKFIVEGKDNQSNDIISSNEEIDISDIDDALLDEIFINRAEH